MKEGQGTKLNHKRDGVPGENHRRSGYQATFCFLLIHTSVFSLLGWFSEVFFCSRGAPWGLCVFAFFVDVVV